jgi:hypothetical protein
MLKPNCRYCQSDKHVKLRRRVNGNGSIAVYWYCLDCEKGAELGERSISHSRANEYLAPYGKTIDDLPIVADYTHESEPCLICGARDTEFNHWLPQMFAERSDVQPDWQVWQNVGAPLCHKHHLLWHRVVTPYMPGIGSNRTIEP